MPKISPVVARLTIIISFALLLTAAVYAIGTLQNPGLEAPFVPYDTYRGWNLQVAQGWNRFYVAENTYNDGSRLRFFSSSDWAAFNDSPTTERIEGDNAQVWWSSSTVKFDAGIYQRVSGLTVGELYGFEAGILQVFEKTGRTDPATGMMWRQVGIDPTGGTDPTAKTVVWSPAETHAAFTDPLSSTQKYTWFYPGVGAKAKAKTITLFIRAGSLGKGTTPNSDQVWADNVFIDVAPATYLTVTQSVSTELTALWEGYPRAGYHLWMYEAQYRPITNSTWTDLQVLTVLSSTVPTATRATFAVEPDKQYVIRARTWQEQDDPGDKREIAGPWAEVTYPKNAGIEGVIINNAGKIVAGATVTATGAISDAVSDAEGKFFIATGGSGTFGVTAAAYPSGWIAPQPVRAIVPVHNTTFVTITLRPPDDFVSPHGDFEGSLSGWHTAITQPHFISASHRAGSYSLCFSQSAAITFTGQVTAMYRPTLAFWYRVDDANPDNQLIAQIFAPAELPATVPLTLTTSAGGWRYARLPLNVEAAPPSGSGSFWGLPGSFYFPQPQTYSGNLGIVFRMRQTGITATTFCLDEVNAGRSPGGPYSIFLPLILKEEV